MAILLNGWICLLLKLYWERSGPAACAGFFFFFFLYQMLLLLVLVTMERRGVIRIFQPSFWTTWQNDSLYLVAMKAVWKMARAW